MSMQENRSEIARLRQRIAEEYDAAGLSLTGFASGSVKHQFITKSMEQTCACHETLQHLVGEQEAPPGCWPRRWKRCNRGQEGGK